MRVAAVEPILEQDRRPSTGGTPAGASLQPGRAVAQPRGGRALARDVNLTSADRVLFPRDRVTKGQLFEYYDAVADVLVPHLRDRPFTMKRSPYGVAGDVYFQKHAPKGMPSWIPTRTYRTYPRGGGSRLVDFPLVNSPEALLWMVQMNCIDMNAWYSRVDKPHRPDFVLFDLDPPDGGFGLAIRVAHLIREELDRLDLESYVKTSGADGIHVLVPIARRSTFDQTYAFAERVARGLEERHPGLVTTEWLKRKREGVLVDHRLHLRDQPLSSDGRSELLVGDLAADRRPHLDRRAVVPLLRFRFVGQDRAPLAFVAFGLAPAFASRAATRGWQVSTASWCRAGSGGGASRASSNFRRTPTTAKRSRP